MKGLRIVWNASAPRYLVALALAASFAGLACNNGVGSGGGNTGGTGGITDETLGFGGTISGKVAESQTTRASLENTSAAQVVPLAIDTENTVVMFNDVVGEPLRDENGQPVPSVPLNGDGSFEAGNLPVGVDFSLCVDVGRDGTCDMENFVQISSTDGGSDGALAGVRPDPLTTLILAKLRAIFSERGIDPHDLPFSPAAVVARVITAYTNLFEESGIDQTLTLADIAALSPAQLADLFDSVIPSNARTGVKIAEGNLGVARASDEGDLALSVAEVFLRAGFPIHDLPDGVDLSPLGNLDDVESMSATEFFSGLMPSFDQPGAGPGGPDNQPGGGPGGPDNQPGVSPGDLANPAGQAVPNGPQGVVYFSTVIEPDRNFANADSAEGDNGDALPQSPVLNDFVLTRMARLQLANRRITVGDLYDLLTDINDGLGARLTYFVDDPNFFGPPLNVFETANGEGKAINIERVFRRLAAEGFENLTPEAIQQREAAIRGVLADLLADTVPPTFERLFKPLLVDRLGTVDTLARLLREGRAHLPFSLSGPSAFFVVADGDSFRTDGVSAITVDAEVDVDGRVSSVTYNPNGDGAFFLGFTGNTDEEGFVEFIVRETGRFLHGPRGPVRLSILDDTVFQPIDGVAFVDFVSESGTFYPGVNVPVFRTDFVPEPREFASESPDGTEGSTVIDEPPTDGEAPPPPDGTEPPPSDGTEPPPSDGTQPPPADATEPPADTPPAPAEFQNDGPNRQIFVLATSLGRDGEPVRVDFDRATGIATFNPSGRNLLQFLPNSNETGLFGLFNEDTGNPARAEDPADFFQPPVDRPENFDQFFNDVGGFDGLDGFDNPNDLVNEIDSTEPPSPDGTDPLPTDGIDQTPTDGTTPVPTDGTNPTPSPDQPAPAAFGGLQDEFGNVLVDVREVIGLPIDQTEFTQVFGTEVPNERYDASRDPFFDDINGDGTHQSADEPTAQFRPLLFNPSDWRSTDIRLYYRRADNGASVLIQNVDFASDTPQTLDGVALVPREYKPRLNAFRFGRPNTAINLLTAFAPRDFFNGTQVFSKDTKVDILSAIALINLVFDQVFNVNADIDVDGIGPLPKQRLLKDAHLFVAPIGDPFVLLLKGFKSRSTVTTEATN